MSVTIEQLEHAGFVQENWPEDLPMPGETNIYSKELDPKRALYRYQVPIDGQKFAMEVLLDLTTAPDPAEGVCFMLNQFAYLWRQDQSQITVQPNGACRRINF
ncbi:MAG: hypothetical protein H0U74_15715 [Bradymonadaceae bacterium]|nr:hypothetical protein [Lujinxingiaceae bacterium]